MSTMSRTDIILTGNLAMSSRICRKQQEKRHPGVGDYGWGRGGNIGAGKEVGVRTYGPVDFEAMFDLEFSDYRKPSRPNPQANKIVIILSVL